MSSATSNAFTIEDLERLPDDGNRYELIGGAIVMTPSPEPLHQRVSRKLLWLLDESCPEGFEVFYAPIDYDVTRGQRVVPDLIIAPDSSVGEKCLVGPVLLVIEIVSPGSVANDRVTKRALYAEAGVPAYWIVDPRARHILALRLRDGSYEAYADTTSVVDLEWPVRVSFAVADLTRR